MTASAQGTEATGRLSALRPAADTMSAALPALMLQAEQIANTLSYGEHGRRRAGIGEAFWQFRHYSPGDEAAKIDWRQSAKSQGHFVRENEWQGAQSVWLWCDRSPSMAYRSAFASQSKQDRALILSLALGGLLTRGGERAGLLQPGAPPPASGRAAFSRLAENLVLTAPADADLPPELALPRFARLVLIGDFLSPLDEIAAIVRAYSAKGVRGHLLQVLDPAEEDLPFTGRIRFEGLQGETHLTVGRVEALRGAYHQRIQQHQDGLRALCRAAGWSFATHRTDRPAPLALLALHQTLSGATPMSR